MGGVEERASSSAMVAGVTALEVLSEATLERGREGDGWTV